MARLSPVARIVPLSRRNSVRLVAGTLFCALVLISTSTLAGAASSKSSGAKISAHLTKTSFTSLQASSVKLVYRFSKSSKSFSYRLRFKKGSKWQTVRSVKKKGHFKGAKRTTVKKLFAGKPIKVGKYRLKLSADGGSKLLGFRVVVVVKPAVTPSVSGKPVNTTLPTISGTATQGKKLTAGNGSWSNSPTSYAYQWRRCNHSGASCTSISGAVSSSYKLALADVRSIIRVVVTAKNVFGSTSATSAQTAVVKGLSPTNTVLPIISGTATQGQKLTASKGSWNNSPTSYSYKWRRCNSSGASCVNISGATSSSYTLVLADAGSTIRVAVTAKNTSGSTSATSAQTVVVTDLPPANTALPIISGTAKQGQKLSASNGSWSNPPVTYAYQWRRCDSSGASCAAISGASASSYTLAAADAFSTIRVVVTASNSYGSASATSAQTAVVATIPAVSAGYDHTCALSSAGTIKCWGRNPNGQLGNGTTTQSSTPVQVKGVDGVGTLSNVTQIDAGDSYTCALSSAGTVKCWGYNNDGALGDGTTTQSSTPVQVKGVGGTGTLSNVTQISAGEDHTCALLSDHTVECWGYNGSGQLGNGTTTQSSTPVQVKGVDGTGTLSNVTQISAGGYHTCALLSGGTVECWGYNSGGQLGNGATTQSSTPVQVQGVGGVGMLSNVTQIDAGYYHTCALLSDSTVECWGWNSNGQLGNGATTQSSTPVQVKDVAGTGALANVTEIEAGGLHTCALLSGGTVECWGWNSGGQLGNGGTTDSSIPVDVIGIP